MGASYDKLISELRRVLERFDVRFALLFGSCVRGEESGLSDVDILAEGNFKDCEVIFEISRELNIPVERVDLVRPNELPVKVLVRALREGVMILCRDVDYFNKLIDRVVADYADVIEASYVDFGSLVDPNAEVDVTRIVDLMNNILSRDKVLKELLGKYALESFEENIVLDLAPRWLVYEIVQSMIDICVHISLRMRLATIESYRDYIVSLIDGRIMDRDLGLKLIEYVSLRNRLAHRYRYVTVEELLGRARKLSEELIPVFIKWVHSIISK